MDSQENHVDEGVYDEIAHNQHEEVKQAEEQSAPDQDYEHPVAKSVKDAIHAYENHAPQAFHKEGEELYEDILPQQPKSEPEAPKSELNPPKTEPNPPNTEPNPPKPTAQQTEVVEKVTEKISETPEPPKKNIEVSPSFKGAGEEPGIEIWRIENMEAVKQDPKNDGIFHKGDCYIVLSTSQVQGSNKLEHDIHFWLGEECSQDESGTAAIRAVELDDGLFGGSAVQHREVQNHESKQFLGYFKKGIRYLDGGVKSGFKEAKDEFTKRMFQLKGKKNVRIAQVECKCAALNQGDTFVLDNGRQLFVWFGPKSNNKERLGGVELAKRIRDEERGGRAHIHTVDKDWNTNDEFFKVLGSKDKVIRAGDDTPDDDIVRKFEQEIILYRIKEDASKPKGAVVTEEASRPLKRSVLNSENCYVLDVGATGIYLWTGKETSTEFRKKVWKACNDFIDTRGYPKWISVTRMMEGAETSLFIQHFAEWPTHMVQPSKGNVAKSDYSGAEGANIAELHKDVETIQGFCPDDGSGKKTVWRIKNMELEPVKEKTHGIFFGGDSYVIQYEYEENRKTKYIIYFWQGNKSSQDEQGAAAAHAVKMDDKLGGQAFQVRVVMHKEPLHFLKMFGGRLIIFEGGHASGFEGVEEYEGFNPEATYMFQIRGIKEEETRAIQVTARAASLNTHDCFIVRSPKKCFVWVGKHTVDAEKDMAKYMLKDLAPKRPNVIVVNEGEEDNSFWTALGGEEPYFKGPLKKEVVSRTPPRLFKCSQASGKFTVEEIAAFAQEDLEQDEVMLLDTFDEIFIWIGKDASDFEKKESMKTAYLYLDSDPTNRTKDNTLIICVRQGFEPPQFTGCFLGWDADLWNKGKTFNELIEEVGKENAGISLAEVEQQKFDKTYPLDVLRRHPPPEYIDVTRKEMYLNDEDFQKVFGMTKAQWEKYPQWKKINKKKEAGLF